MQLTYSSIRYYILYMVGLSILCYSAVQCADEDHDVWRIAKQKAENAVVQVWVQLTETEWLKPYRSPEQGQGAGSGFFLDKQGHILTNYHVVAGAKSAFVNLPVVGKDWLDVVIVGVCPDLDIAVIKLTDESYEKVKNTCGEIKTIDFGDSDALDGGHQVLAFGFPLAFPGLKTTDGCIAGRDFLEGRSLIHFTSQISKGSSGGPALNRKGEVIGITVSNIDEGQNHNYIVPSSDIKIALPTLFKMDLVRRPQAGMITNHCTEAHAHSLHNPLPSGVYVNFVLEHSMEEKAGLKAGDVMYGVQVSKDYYIVNEFGQVAVSWRKDKIFVAELLSRCRIGDPVVFTVYRNGEKLELKCNFQESVLYPIRVIFAEFEPQELDYEIIGGLVVMQLRGNHFGKLPKTHQLREYARIENHTKPALVITSIIPGSQAHRSECLMPGFIIDKINGQSVTTLAEFREALMLSVNSKELAIKTKDKYETVLDIKKIVDEESRLSRDYRFPITDTVMKLIKEVKK